MALPSTNILTSTLGSLAKKKILGIPVRVGLIAVVSVILIAGVSTYVFLNPSVTPTGEADDVIKEEEIRIPEGAHEVQSQDGLAILSIPQSALPDGVDISDISITKLTESQVMLAVEGAEIIGYEMQPDGLEFLEEVFLTLTLDINSSVPLLLQTRQDNLRILNITDVGIDSENLLFVTASISHFSDIYSVFREKAKGLLSYSITNQGLRTEETLLSQSPSAIGDPIRASASITIVSKSLEVTWRRNNNPVLVVLEFEELKVNMVLVEPFPATIRPKARALSPLEPKMVVVKIPTTKSLVDVGDKASVLSLTDFTCTKAGRASVWFWFGTTRIYTIAVHAQVEGKFLAEPITTISDQQVKLVAWETTYLDCGIFPADFSQLEKISVPVDGSSVVSNTILEFGIIYKLRASGTFTIGGPGFADAEYAFGDGNIYDHCNIDPSDVDLGIGVDGIRWGGYKSDHVYLVDFVGIGAPITISYRDCNYPDNSPGDLSVEIFGVN